MLLTKRTAGKDNQLLRRAVTQEDSGYYSPRSNFPHEEFNFAKGPGEFGLI